MKIFLSILAVFMSVISLAQTTAPLERPVSLDSMPISEVDTLSLSASRADSISRDDKVSTVATICYTPGMIQFMMCQAAMRDSLSMSRFAFVPGVATVASWRNGQMLASGYQRVMPGLMQVDHGSLGVSQTAGDFSFYAGASADKYGYFQGLYTQYGLGGSVSYRFNPRLSLTLFGNYYFGSTPYMAGGLPMSPAMMGYYQTNSFGGYFDYRADSRIGVLFGARTVQQIGTDRYRSEPIVTPYVKVGKIGIGLPIGQLLYGLLGY